MSYKVECEDCGNSISAAARFCPWCGTEQERAVDAIGRMRDTDPTPIRTDGGGDEIHYDERAIPFWAWWLLIVAISTVTAVVICTGRGGL